MRISSIIKKTILTIITVIAVLFVVGAVIAAAIMFAISKNFPDMNQMKLESLLQETSYIYDDSGTISEKIQSNVDRTIVPIEQIPSQLQKAFIAIEDERFLEHGGVDVKRLFGALVHDIKVGSFEQGGSTINMQLSKNLLTSTEKSAMRKLTDIVYAVKLDQQLSKNDIIYAYLNTVFLGSNVNGVQAAAKSYFNKDVQDLNLMECAVIAGITQYPSRYIPYKLSEITESDDLANIQIKLYPPSTEGFVPSDEQKAIYAKLRDLGRVDYYESMMLMNGSLVATRADLNEASVQRAKIVLSKMLELGFINNDEYNEALNTPITIQFPPRNNRGISSYFNDKVKKEAVKILIELGNSEEQADNLLKFGGLKIYTTLNTKMQKILEDAFAESSNFPDSFYDENGIIQPQAAMVVMDQHNGYVKAYIGGRGQAGSFIYDRADSPRQPGSAIKPLAVYLLALKDGMTPDTIINDAPMKDPSSPTGYWPKNIFDKYYGNQTMRFLIQVSSNVAAVKTLETLAPTKIEAANRSLDYLTQMGFRHLVRSSENRIHNDENMSLALGGLTKGVTTLEMASAYAGIANLGKQISPVFITKIVDASDNVIYESKPKVYEMIGENKAYQMVSMLSSVVTSGHAGGALLPNMPSAGKTGTTTDVKDVYFVGFTPYYTASVWMGCDIPQELKYTSAGPTRFWGMVMKQIDEQMGLGYKAFDSPSGSEPVDTNSINVLEEQPGGSGVIDPNEDQRIDDIIFEGEQRPQGNQNEQGSRTQTQQNQELQQQQQPGSQQDTSQGQPPAAAPEPQQPEPPVDTGQETAPDMVYEQTDQNGSNDANVPESTIF